MDKNEYYEMLKKRRPGRPGGTREKELLNELAPEDPSEDDAPTPENGKMDSLAEDKSTDTRNADAEAEETPRSEERDEPDALKDVGRIILMDVVLDGTFSFSTVFPAVYYILEKLVEKLKAQLRDLPYLSFRYGLTVIREEQHKGIPLGGNKDDCFTDDAERFLNAVRALEFRGGSEDGYEDVTGAIRGALHKLNEFNAPGGQRVDCGLLVFSDSIPKSGTDERSMNPPLDGEEMDDLANRGLRFANIYTFDSKYQPVLCMVDKDTIENGNARQHATYASLGSVIKDRKKAVNEIEKIVGGILEQTSV